MNTHPKLIKLVKPLPLFTLASLLIGCTTTSKFDFQSFYGQQALAAATRRSHDRIDHQKERPLNISSDRRVDFQSVLARFKQSQAGPVPTTALTMTFARGQAALDDRQRAKLAVFSRAQSKKRFQVTVGPSRAASPILALNLSEKRSRSVANHFRTFSIVVDRHFNPKQPLDSLRIEPGEDGA